MKKVLWINLLLTIFLVLACSPETPPQPRSNYDIALTISVPNIVKYHYFMEKESSGGYHLVNGADYLAPSLLAYKVGESSLPVFTVNLLNDGAEYTVGVVMENSQGFYSGLGTAIGVVGEVPPTPGGIVFRKTQQ